MNVRVLFYVQHLLGIGHFRRAAVIARTLAADGIEVTLVSGGEAVPDIDLGRAGLIQLPPALTSDTGFSQILDSDRRPIDDDWRVRRQRLLLDAFDQVAPHLLLVELFPFGRRAFRFELLPLLEAAMTRRPRPAILCSLRDILVGLREPAKLANTVTLVRRYFDRVLVHGDPRLIRLDESFPAADQIAEKLHYTGYVVDDGVLAPPGAAGAEVLVSVGGGAVGAPLLQAAIEARALSRLAAAPWRILTGTGMGEQAVAALALAAPTGIVVERFRRDFPDLLRGCRLSLSQAGYNTVMEVLAAGTRAVVVPFADGNETEQTIRARLLAERGLLAVVEAAGLTPERLATALDAALDRPPREAAGIALGGARTTAETLARLARAVAAGKLAKVQNEATGLRAVVEERL